MACSTWFFIRFSPILSHLFAAAFTIAPPGIGLPMRRNIEGSRRRTLRHKAVYQPVEKVWLLQAGEKR